MTSEIAASQALDGLCYVEIGMCWTLEDRMNQGLVCCGGSQCAVAK
eukprot:CAMPEP_0204356260 /NCGR_PEP_ID=MMETSP0469-20131031/34812_1 /ASSEMBLY_ACC=CAM_ASM_000384 /TAXON_ID=2969 /ORGANISM="Oxyrrhis marina" /LENGTH=45 /DNA_ID= /DNA_START= /DNA_END= /DNA_ORIENTATION=